MTKIQPFDREKIMLLNPRLFSLFPTTLGTLGGPHCCAESIYPKVITKKVPVVLLTEFYFISTPSVVQVVQSTARLAKFSEAVTKALSTSQGFDSERDVLPQEFRGLLEKERGVMDINEPNKELVKMVIESKVGSADNGV